MIETIDQNGEVKRAGECLLGVWAPPVYETGTCSQYVKKGTFKDSLPKTAQRVRTRRRIPDKSSGGVHEPLGFRLPEEILDMDADEFRSILRDVIRDELGVTEVALAGKWEGGEIIIKPAKEGIQEKRVPLESLFHKIVMIRDKLRVLEQKINGHEALSASDKVQLQAYITGCYGSLTTFNILFSDRAEGFNGAGRDD